MASVPPNHGASVRCEEGLGDGRHKPASVQGTVPERRLDETRQHLSQKLPERPWPGPMAVGADPQQTWEAVVAYKAAA